MRAREVPAVWLPMTDLWACSLYAVVAGRARLLKLHATMDDSLRVHFRKRRPSALAADGEPVIGLLLALGTMEGMPAGPSG